MKTKFLVLILFLVTILTYGQVKFERGYFITNAGKRIDCYIKNYDRERISLGFEYSFNENDTPSIGVIDSVKEFGIAGVAKFLRANVKIDRSSDELASLSTQRSPEWSEEQLFLQILIEGKATLYQYREINFERFFYSISGSPILQLMYKEYLIREEGVAYNFDFRQQLWKDLRIEDQPQSSVENIRYNHKELERYFTQYNGVGIVNPVIQNKDTNNSSSLFLRIAPGMNYTSFEINRLGRPILYDYSDKSVSYRLGLQSGIILPYNRNKWALLIEPSYVFLKTKNNGMQVNYRAVEFPIGVRYCFFLHENIRLYLNAFYVPGLKVYFDRSIVLITDIGLGPTTQQYTLPNRNCMAFGCGVNFNKISFEYRFYAKSDVFDQYADWKTSSFILSYQIFR